MITTTYICDKCKQPVPVTDLYDVNLHATLSVPSHRNPYTLKPVVGPSQICFACLQAAGFFKQEPKPDEPHVPPPTLEDLITALVIDTVQEHLPS